MKRMDPALENLERDSQEHFTSLVESVGVKQFATQVGLTTRQINRIRSGASPNPIFRLVRFLQSADVASGDRTLDFVCSEMGGHFVRHVNRGESISEAVKETAEAIAAMSDGALSDRDVQEIREAISALSSVLSSRSPSAPGSDD